MDKDIELHGHTRNALERQDIIVQRHAEGISVKEIAEEMSLTPQVVRQSLAAASDDFVREIEDVVLLIKVTHNDRLQDIYTKAMEGWQQSVDNDKPNSKFLDVMIKAMESQRKIWGADAPLKRINANLQIKENFENKASEDPNFVPEVVDMLKQIGVLPTSLNSDTLRTALEEGVIDVQE